MRLGSGDSSHCLRDSTPHAGPESDPRSQRRPALRQSNPHRSLGRAFAKLLPSLGCPRCPVRPRVSSGLLPALRRLAPGWSGFSIPADGQTHAKDPRRAQYRETSPRHAFLFVDISRNPVAPFSFAPPIPDKRGGSIGAVGRPATKNGTPS